jgi:hypothetical protein
MTNYRVEARRWFQKTYGNTYHSVRIFDEDGNLIACERFTYGYDDQYLQTAYELLKSKGVEFATIKDMNDFLKWSNRQSEGISAFVVDVKRKRDL